MNGCLQRTAKQNVIANTSDRPDCSRKTPLPSVLCELRVARLTDVGECVVQVTC